MNRAQRRAATRGDHGATRTLYHGTTAVLADLIRTEGLRPGRDGRVYVTDSRAMAQRYATWATAMASTVPRPSLWAPRNDIGRQAVDIGDHVAVVAHVRVPADAVVHREYNSSAPPLPWETTTVDGDAFYVERALPAACVRPFELFPVPELEQAGMRARVALEADLIAAAFRRQRMPGANAPAASGRFAAALPSPFGLLEAAIEASPAPESGSHGVVHWLHVAAAGARLLEAGADADPAVLFAFAVLHDVYRHAAGAYADHGARAANLARQLAEERHLLSPDQLDTLTAALAGHVAQRVSQEPTIGACWDADRLTLPRLGVTVDPALLSTPEGRALAATPERIPAPEDCDWPWILFRYHIEASQKLATEKRAA